LVEIGTETQAAAETVSAAVAPITANATAATAFLQQSPGLETLTEDEVAVTPPVVVVVGVPALPPPPPPAEPPVALGECPSWCNAYTCDMTFCKGCTTCSALANGQYCAGWCNDWTTWSEYCGGCTVSAEAQAKCYTQWCNVYICGLTDTCSGCGFCTSLTAGTHCADWCNPWTSWMSYCSGC